MVYQAKAVEDCIKAGQLECPEYPLEESIVVAQIMDTYRKQVGIVYPCEKSQSAVSWSALQTKGSSLPFIIAHPMRCVILPLQPFFFCSFVLWRTLRHHSSWFARQQHHGCASLFCSRFWRGRLPPLLARRLPRLVSHHELSQFCLQVRPFELTTHTRHR